MKNITRLENLDLGIEFEANRNKRLSVRITPKFQYILNVYRKNTGLNVSEITLDMLSDKIFEKIETGEITLK